MDTTTVLALVVGVNSGMLICGLFFFLYSAISDRNAEYEDDDDRPASSDMGIGHAMSVLCASVTRANPNWHTIEITREGDNNASMLVKGDATPDSGNKLH